MALTLREKNDAIRRRLPIIYRPHRLLTSPEVQALEIHEQRQIIEAVRDFKDFPEDDFHHDTGVVTLFERKWRWKFDYYDRNLEHYKHDGVRVLTVVPSRT